MSYDNYDDGFEDRPQPRTGMSTAVKVLIGLLVAGGLFIVVCCGVGIYFFSRASVTTPEGVRELTNEIIQIDVPDQFPPQFGVRLNFFGMGGMKAVIYADDPNDPSGSQLVILELSVPDSGDDQLTKEELGRQLEQQGQAEQFQPKDLQDATIETRMLKVQGKEVEFEFIKGKSPDTGTVMHQVTGSFPNDNGIVVLAVQVPEDEYDEEVILKMIESIR